MLKAAQLRSLKQTVEHLIKKAVQTYRFLFKDISVKN